MRVALFSGNYNYLREGANQALNRLVSYLESVAGHEVRVYSPVTQTPAFVPAGTLVPIPSITLPIRNEFQLALGLPRSIRKDIARFAPDLVHISTPDILNTRAQTFAKSLGVPVVASLHTRFEAYLDYYRLGWARPLVEAHLNRFYRRSDHVLVPTEAIASEMRQLRGDDQVTVWSRGIDRQLFNPARRDCDWRRSKGFDDKEIVVLFFGRLVLEKGVDSFLQVMASLRNKGVFVRPLVVGEGPERHKFDSIEGAVLTGHLEGTELAKAVASADIMFHPSTTEAFGNVVLEAMASGLPVVAIDAASSRSLLMDGKAGLLFPEGDLDSCAAAIELLARSPDRRAALGSAAELASASYTWEAASAMVERTYLNLLGKPVCE